MTVKEYLEQLTLMDKEINRKQQRLVTLRDIVMNTTPTYDGEMVQHSRDKNPLEKIMTKIVDLDREIDSDIDRLVDLKAEVWEQLEVLEDERYIRVLWLRYAEGKTWRLIAEAMGFTSRYVRNIHSKALCCLEKIKKDHPCST